MDKIHKAQVHVCTDSVLCLGAIAQNQASRRWNVRYEGRRSHKEVSHKLDGQHVDFVFNVLPRGTSHEVMCMKVHSLAQTTRTAA